MKIKALNQSNGKRASGPDPTSEAYLRMLKGEISTEEYVETVNRQVEQKQAERHPA
jgi:hypothetical protein